MDDIPAVQANALQICVGCGGPWPRLGAFQTPILGKTKGSEMIELKACNDCGAGVSEQNHRPCDAHIERGYVPGCNPCDYENGATIMERVGAPIIEFNTMAAPVTIKNTMTGAELIIEHKAITDKLHQICKDKNADYAGQGGNKDAFANLSMIETASHGVIKAEWGFLTRMSDKWSRLLSLLTSGKEAQVKNESIEDTLLDQANYCILLAIYLRRKRNAAASQ